MRIVFLGTPDFGVPSLEALIREGHEVVAAFTQPDRPKGRGKKMEFCPVKACAVSHGIPVYQPVKIRLESVDDLKALAPDVCVTAAFGQILSQEILDIPKIGTVNVHSSLLPKYRGSSPINWAIICGETVTGVTTMMTDKGMDTGDILLQKEVEILPGETAGELTDRLAEIGAELLVETLRQLEKGICPRKPQDHEQMSYYPMLKKEMGLIDWGMGADEIICRIRGLSPWPGTYTYIGGEMLKVWQGAAEEVNIGQPGDILEADGKKGLLIQAGKNAVRVQELQAQGGKRIKAVDYLRGHPVTATACDKNEE